MKKHNFKKAVIDQIILWIVIFTSFVGLLFFVIDYSNALKVNENADSIANYTARMVSLSEDESDIVNGINNIKGDYVSTIQSADLVCSENQANLNRQVIVNVYATLDNDFLTGNSNNVHAKAVVYNESSEFEKVCNLTLGFN